MSFSMVSMTHGGSWLTVSGVHVSQANDLLGASYQLYRHTAANTTVLRTISYGLPAELHAVEHLGNPRGVRTILLSWQRCSISNGPAQGYTMIWLLTGVSRRQLNMEQCAEDLPQLPGPVVSEILASTRFSSCLFASLSLPRPRDNTDPLINQIEENSLLKIKRFQINKNTAFGPRFGQP